MTQYKRDVLTALGFIAGILLGPALLFFIFIFNWTWFPSIGKKNKGSIEMAKITKLAVLAYFEDAGSLPPTDNKGYLGPALTTPVNYIELLTEEWTPPHSSLSELPVDPFNDAGPEHYVARHRPVREDFKYRYKGPAYRLIVPPAGIEEAFILGCGPDGDADFLMGQLQEGTFKEARTKFVYDPTNGTLSEGDLMIPLDFEAWK